MIKQIAIILFVWTGMSSIASAQYTLKDFGKNNKSNSREELLKALNLKITDLYQYKCPQLKDTLFTDFLFNQSAHQFLKIQDKRNKIVTYQFGKIINAKNKEIKPRGFFKDVYQALQKLGQTTTGQRFLNEIQRSPYPLIIREGMNRFDPRYSNEGPARGLNTAAALQSLHTGRLSVDGLRYNQFGSGGFVWWSPKLKAKTQDEDRKIRQVPTFIALAHELYHAYDSVRGLLDRRFIAGTGYEFLEVTEYRAVFFENKIREENGLYKRLTYSETLDPIKGKVLDQNGDPIWIPISCLP